MDNKKVVVITGGSKGLGKQICSHFKSEEYIVISLSRTVILSDTINIKCDIQDNDQISQVIKDIYDKYKRIDIVISNAGMGISGSVENTPIQAAQKIVNTNFFGTFYLAKATLPYLRESKGKLVIISSVAAIMPIAYQTFYSSTKAAVALLGDGIRNEARSFGVQVMNVLPGDIKTEFTSNREKNIKDGVYTESAKKSIAVMEKDEQNGMSVEWAANKIFKYIVRKKMPNQVIIGTKYRFLCAISKILPKRALNTVLYKMYGGQ